MEKRDIIGIASIIAIVVMISLWSFNSILPSAETNQTVQPVRSPAMQSNQVMGILSHNITLEKSLPEKEETVVVYKTVPEHYTRQDILSMAQKFNISSTTRIKEVPEGSSIFSEDKTVFAILHNSGFVEYYDSTRVGNINPFDVPGNLPSDDEALKIASKFLHDRNLLPEGAEFKRISHGKILGSGENGSDVILWEDVQVWFGRKIERKTVEGTQLMLAIGGNGDPIEFFTNWRKYEPYVELPVKTPEQAFKDLKTQGVSTGINKQGTVSINNAYLAYHTKAGAYTEEYLEPVWVFKGNVMVDGKAVDSVEAYIPALSDEAVKSLSS